MAVDEPESGGIPEWVVTFGDMMSLLLTFFIMLVSLSEIKSEEQYQALIESIRKQFGYEMSKASISPGTHRPRNDSRLSHLATLGRAQRQHTLAGGDKVRAPVGENPRVQAIRPADRTTTGGVLYFDADQTQLTAKQKQTLQAIALEVGGKLQKIEIRGHASGRPSKVDGPGSDLWQLAYERCHHVMDFLVSLGIDPQRIRLSVAAQHEPAQVTSDPALLKQNDRVEVFLLNELTADPKRSHAPETK